MHPLRIFILIVCLGFIQKSKAQQQEMCGHNQVLELLEKQYPGFKNSYDKAYLAQVHPKVVKSRKVFYNDTFYTYDTVFVLPVVFHVLYNNSGENIADSYIYNQMEILNRDYRRLNADTVNTRSIFKTRAGDTRIQFELAKINPQGNSTNGIIRKSTTVTTFGKANGSLNENMKFSSQGGDDVWDPSKYLNIWVCDLYYPGSGQYLFGFAYPPYGHPNWPKTSWGANANQGVVLHYTIVGSNNPLATGTWAISNQGRVAVHEVGHYLGLRHIWGDGTACVNDDYLYDTPKQGYKSQSTCFFSQNTCWENSGPDFPDMVENYMDYSNSDCQNMFTKEQIGVMKSCIKDYRFNVPVRTIIDTNIFVLEKVLFDQLKIFVTEKQRIYFELPNADILENLQVDLYDVSGKIVLQNGLLTKNENYISTVNFAPGIYLLNLKDKNNKSLRREKLFISKI